MKYSKQRSLILDIVKSAKNHPTADWVYEQAKKQSESIGIATVYRNLNALAEDGEIGRVIGSNQSVRFDGEMREHFHLECTKCGKLVDLFPKGQEQIENLTADLIKCFGIEGNDIRLNRILLQGICDECAKKKKDNLSKMN